MPAARPTEAPCGTAGLDYAERYAQRCLGLIVRGIYLNTKPEFDAIYARSSFTGDVRAPPLTPAPSQSGGGDGGGRGEE